MLYELLESHKRGADSRELDPLTECVKECFECAEYCTICADACLSENMVADLHYCIRTDLDCADICLATGRMAAGQTKPSREIMRAQLQACMTAYRRCENACQSLLTIVPQ